MSNYKKMQYDIQGNPDFGEVTVRLEPGENIYSESGAMTRMSANTEVERKVIGGMLKGLFRKATTGESLYVGNFSNQQGGEVSFAPSMPGTVMHRKMTGDEFYLTAGSFLACTPDVNLSTQFGGMKAMFSKEGVFLIKASGNGDLFFNSYGGIIERDLNGPFTVDNAHVVAWEPTLDYKITGMGNLKSTFLSGEGLVMKFNGHGKIYLQTRTIPALVDRLSPLLRP